MADSVYVEVMARLAAVRSAELASSDSLPPARAESLRARVLQEFGVGRDELESFARAVGDEPARMRRLWERVSARTDSLRQVGWAGPEGVASSADTAPGRGPAGPEVSDTARPPNQTADDTATSRP